MDGTATYWVSGACWVVVLLSLFMHHVLVKRGSKSAGIWVVVARAFILLASLCWFILGTGGDIGGGIAIIYGIINLTFGFGWISAAKRNVAAKKNRSNG